MAEPVPTPQQLAVDVAERLRAAGHDVSVRRSLPEGSPEGLAFLRDTCLGRLVWGVDFAMGFVIRLENEARLQIEHGWTLLPRASFNMGAMATALSEWSLEQQLSALARLRGLPITGVELGEPWHHLALTFGDQWVMFINGQHDVYETWQLELDDALLVSVPNGSTVFFPGKDRS